MANSTTLYRGNDGRTYVDVTEAKSLVAADSGIVQNVIADGVTVTLPTSAAATVGATFTVRNGGAAGTGAAVGTGANGTVLVTLAPVAADGISGAAFTAATNKAALNTKATSVVGDELTVEGSGVTSAAAWFVTGMKGIWARAA